jgi:hypothetical protein
MDLADRFAASGVLISWCSPFRVVTRNASLLSWRLLKWMKEAALTVGISWENVSNISVVQTRSHINNSSLQFAMTHVILGAKTAIYQKTPLY